MKSALIAMLFAYGAIHSLLTGLWPIYSGKARMFHHVAYRRERPGMFWFCVLWKLFIFVPVAVAGTILFTAMYGLGK